MPEVGYRGSRIICAMWAGLAVRSRLPLHSLGEQPVQMRPTGVELTAWSAHLQDAAHEAGVAHVVQAAQALREGVCGRDWQGQGWLALLLGWCTGLPCRCQEVLSMARAQISFRRTTISFKAGYCLLYSARMAGVGKAVQQVPRQQK